MAMVEDVALSGSPTMVVVAVVVLVASCHCKEGSLFRVFFEVRGGGVRKELL